MTPTDLAQRTYLEQRREILLDMQMDVVKAAMAARARFNALPKHRICPKEVDRMEHYALEAERRSFHLMRAISAIGAELS